MTAAERLQAEKERLLATTGFYVPPYRMANLMKAAAKIMDIVIKADTNICYLPEGFKKVREIIYTALFVVILSVLCWQGWLQAQEFVGVTLMGLPVDKFYIYLAIPVGAALMMLQYLLNLFCAFCDKKKGEIDE